MNKITMTLQADHLILEALKEDISSGALTHSAPILDISLKNLHAI